MAARLWDAESTRRGKSFTVRDLAGLGRVKAGARAVRDASAVDLQHPSRLLTLAAVAIPQSRGHRGVRARR